MAKLDSGAMTIGNNDNWREIFDDQNATAQAANQATADLAPIINGKRCALSVASGGFVLLRNSTITGKADGAYTAAKAIPANTDLDGSYLTAVSGGVANALNGKIPTITIGQFQVATINGSKAIQRTDLNTAPPDLRYCSYTVVSHAQDYKPTSIEVDNANTLVVTSTGVQTITVRWFYMKF